MPWCSAALWPILFWQVQAAAQPFWPHALLSRKPIFNQAICNHYRPGEGISAHVDLAAFADGIAGISLQAAAVMDFVCLATAQHVEARKQRLRLYCSCSLPRRAQLVSHLMAPGMSSTFYFG